jgi:hypothetical protein
MITTPAIIDDMSQEFPLAAIGTKWQLVSDAVMGGVSSGRISRVVADGRPAIRMQGSVSLENNGGFIQAALDLAPDGGTINAGAFTGIALDVLGNGEHYGLHLRTPDLTRPWQSYRQSFVAEPAWREVRLPFTGFQPYRTDVPLDVRYLRRLGLVAIGRAFQADLCLIGIRFYLSPVHTRHLSST